MREIAPTTTQHVDVPDGFDIAGAPTLLDSTVMLDRINFCLPTGVTPFNGCRISNLRQKTPASCTIAYELIRGKSESASLTHTYVRAFSRGEYDNARRRALQSRWVASEESLTVTPLDDVHAILYWFPNDERLDGLRRIVIPKKLQRIFYDRLTEYPNSDWRISDRSIRLQVVRYKPERRAVLRCRFRAQRHDDADRHERFVYLGLYETERFARLWETTSTLTEIARYAHDWTPARTLALDQSDALIIFAELDGRPLRDMLGVDGWPDALERTARAVAEMHRADAHMFTETTGIRDQIGQVRGMLTRVAPECREIVDSLSSRLMQSDALKPSASLNLVHGDLHHGQLLIGEGKVGVIDFDRVHGGDALEDVGNFCAQLWLGPRDGRRWEFEPAREQFIDCYERARQARIDRARVSTWMALSLFRSALTPLGRFEASWRQRVRTILAEAQRVLP